MLWKMMDLKVDIQSVKNKKAVQDAAHCMSSSLWLSKRQAVFRSGAYSSSARSLQSLFWVILPSLKAPQRPHDLVKTRQLDLGP